MYIAMATHTTTRVLRPRIRNHQIIRTIIQDTKDEGEDEGGRSVLPVSFQVGVSLVYSVRRKTEMEEIFNYPWQMGVVLALVLAGCLDLGRRVAASLKLEQAPQRKEQMGTIRDGMFVLVSLLLGFTLTMAAARFTERRSLLVEEAISIGATYLRANTLPQPYREHSRELLREYVDARLVLNDVSGDSGRMAEVTKHCKHLQEELWSDAAAVAQSDRSAITAGYINLLTETIDLDEKRIASLENRIPLPIWLLIGSVSIIAVFTRGTTLASRFWLTLILVPITIALVAALIADLDAPTRGLILLDQRAMQRVKADISAETAN